jgi:hypothetical protein
MAGPTENGTTQGEAREGHGADGGPHEDGTDRADHAAERIREASLELISAARKLLDAAEEVVADPDRLAANIRNSSNFVEDLLHRVGRFGAEMGRSPAHGSETSEEDDAGGRVQQIPLD